MKKAEAVVLLSVVMLTSVVVVACGEDNKQATVIQPAQTPDSGIISAPDAQAPAATDAQVAVVQDAGGSSAMDASGARPDAGVTVTVEAGADAGEAGVVASGDPEFDSCFAQVKPLCIAKDMNTAELMEVPCKALQNIALPLTNGMSLGPVTIQGGPYAAKIDWNEGDGTPHVVAELAFESVVQEQICLAGGIDTFAEPTAVTDELKNTRMLDSRLFTIFRPACMKKGEKYPVITWANGTCGLIHGYSALLSTVASHGFVIIASNSTWTNTPPTDTVQLKALDYAKTLNEDPKSPLYQRLDLEHIGAEGHSQGAAATAVADSDPRIDSLIFWNSQTSNEKPFLNVSGERDTTERTPADMMASATAATKPGAWIYYHKIPQTGGTATGHLTLMEQPERVVNMAIAWWKWQLKGDQEAKKMFIGDNCGLCTMKEEFEFGHNMLLQ